MAEDNRATRRRTRTRTPLSPEQKARRTQKLIRESRERRERTRAKRREQAKKNLKSARKNPRGIVRGTKAIAIRDTRPSTNVRPRTGTQVARGTKAVAVRDTRPSTNVRPSKSSGSSRNTLPAKTTQSSGGSRVSRFVKKVAGGAGKVMRGARLASPVGLLATGISATLATNKQPERNKGKTAGQIRTAGRKRRKQAAEERRQQRAERNANTRVVQTRRGKRRVPVTPQSSGSPQSSQAKPQSSQAKPQSSSRSSSSSSSNVPRNSVTGKPLTAFERAFAKARRDGEATFPFRGKTYHTRRADDKPRKKRGKQNKKQNKPQSQRSPTVSQMYRKQFTEEDGRRMEALANRRGEGRRQKNRHFRK